MARARQTRPKIWAVCPVSTRASRANPPARAIPLFPDVLPNARQIATRPSAPIARSTAARLSVVLHYFFAPSCLPCLTHHFPPKKKKKKQDSTGGKWKYLMAQTEVFSHFLAGTKAEKAKKQVGRRGKAAEEEEDAEMVEHAEEIQTVRLTVQPECIKHGQVRGFPNPNPPDCLRSTRLHRKTVSPYKTDVFSFLQTDARLPARRTELDDPFVRPRH